MLTTFEQLNMPTQKVVGIFISDRFSIAVHIALKLQIHSLRSRIFASRIDFLKNRIGTIHFFRFMKLYFSYFVLLF